MTDPRERQNRMECRKVTTNGTALYGDGGCLWSISVDLEKGKMIDLHPTRCNLCGGRVLFISNAVIYGKEYGSGKCYLCQECGAYTGTHKPRPTEALGLLSDEPMRKGKKMCHKIFDDMWRGKPKASKKRKDLYLWLAGKMSIPIEECHFGYFDINQLRKAYRILENVRGLQMKYDNNGMIYFEEERKDNDRG